MPVRPWPRAFSEANAHFFLEDNVEEDKPKPAYTTADAVDQLLQLADNMIVANLVQQSQVPGGLLTILNQRRNKLGEPPLS